MSLTIARIYPNQEAANAAADELRESGFSPEIIQAGGEAAAPETIPEGSAADTAGKQADPVLDSIIKAGVGREHAGIYAQHVHRNQVLVLVEPPFGFGKAVTAILDRHHPVEVNLPEVQYPYSSARTWDPAAPLSSWMGWRVLLDDPAPLSNYLKRPVLKPEPASSPTLARIRQRSNDPAPLSAKIGMSALDDNPTPLSTKIGWRVLLDKAAPLSERLGWRLLSDTAAPLSERFGWRLLLNNPAPLSSWLGWRTLSDNPAPLSSWLGWRTLRKD